MPSVIDVDPKIAVIVAAYDRKEYIEQALSSVFAQSLPRSSYELVVIKNFDLPDYDRYLEENGAKVLHDDNPKVGEFLLRAISFTTAPLIAILDDDDQWEPDRLSIALSEFKTDPLLGYYHNRVSVIDSNGRYVSEDREDRLGAHQRAESLDLVTCLPVGPEEKETMGDAIRASYPMFNASAIVFRREILEGPLREEFAKTQNQDQMIFLAGLESPFGIFLDADRLTRYREHANNITKTAWAREHGYRDALDLAEIARTVVSKEYSDWFLERAIRLGRQAKEWFVVDSIRNGEPARNARAHLRMYLDYVKRNRSRPRGRLSTLALRLYVVSYLFAPNATRRVLERRIAKRSV
jgi:glycosyltransferase involved in cell wall biosynthesis